MDLIQEEECLEASIYHYFYWKAIQSQNISSDENDSSSISNHHDEINDDDDKTKYYTTVGGSRSSSITDNIDHPTTTTTLTMMTAASSITDDDDNSNSNNNKLNLQNSHCIIRCKESSINHITKKLTLSEKYRQIYILIQQYFPDVTKDHVTEYEIMMSTTVPEVHRRFIGYPQLLQDHLSLHSICHSNGVVPPNKIGKESFDQQFIRKAQQEHQQEKQQQQHQHQISFTPSITSKTSCIQQNDNYIKFGVELNSKYNIDSNDTFDPDKIFDPKLNQILKLNNIATKSINKPNSMNQNQFGNKIYNKSNTINFNNINRYAYSDTFPNHIGELNGNFRSNTIQNHYYPQINYPQIVAHGATRFNSSSDNITHIGPEGAIYQQNLMMPRNFYLKQAANSSESTNLSTISTPTLPSALIISLPSQTQKAPDNTALHQIDSKQQQQEQEQIPTIIPGSTAWCLIQRQKLGKPRKSDNTGEIPVIKRARSKVTTNKIVNSSRVNKVKNNVWQLVHNLHQRDNDDDLMSHSSSQSRNILDKSSSDEEEHDDDEDSWIRTKQRGRKRKDPSFMTSRRKSEESTPKRITRSLTNSLPDTPVRLTGDDLPPSRSKRYKRKPKSPIMSNHHRQQRPIQEYQASFMKPMINSSSEIPILEDRSKEQNIDRSILCVDKRFPMTFEGRFDLLKRYKDYHGHCRIEVPSTWDTSNKNHGTYSKLYHWLSSLSCCYQQQQKQQQSENHQEDSLNNQTKSVDNLGLFSLSEERIERLRSIGFEFNIEPST